MEHHTRSLPPVTRLIVEAIGWEQATSLLEAYGGRPVYLGPRLGLSEGQLKALQRALDCHLGADNRLCLPKADKLFIRLRDERIRQLRGQGLSYPDLSRRFRLTTRHLMNIVGAEAVAAQCSECQPSLFD